MGGFRHDTRLRSHKARFRIPQGAWHCDWHSGGGGAFGHWLRAVGIRIQVLPASSSGRDSSEKSGWEEGTEQKGILGGWGSC